MKKIGYAVDIGTTTIDVCLADIEAGCILSKKSTKNRQSLYGSDVLNRILTVTRNPEYIKALKALVIEDITKMLMEMLRDTGCEVADVVKLCICGNTTMISILLEYNIEKLGKNPFESDLSQNVSCRAKRLFDINDLDCEVILSGCASAFIGGDILSGLIFLTHNYHFTDGRINMLIDLGTNGEMVLIKDDKYFSASTACGPAFEGCVKKQNVYGSNVIDAIMMGIKSGKINRDGIISEPFFEKGINIMNIHIDMDILRQFILAKSAVAAGIDAIVATADISLSDIDNIYISGGFGLYLNLNNAIDIGLFPVEFRGKLNIVGNTSLHGAFEILCNESYVDEMNYLTKDKIKLIQLAENDIYKKRLIEHMHL